MAVCTKFKITSWILNPGLRAQPFGTGNEINESTKTRVEKKESTKNSQFKASSLECSKNDNSKNCFASGANAKYMEYLFSKWIKNVNSVHKSWNLYFTDLMGGQTKAKVIKSVDQSTDKSKVKLQVAVDELSKQEEPGTIKEIKQWNLKSKESPVVANDGSSNWPPLPTQEQTCVVGHINLSPLSGNSPKDILDKSTDINDLIKNSSKPANKNRESSHSSSKKQLGKNENVPSTKRVKTALDEKAFKTAAKELKEQIKRTKSFEQKNTESREPNTK